MFVKICGLAREEDVRATAACGPDALGFVFWPNSRRAVHPADVRRWTEGIDPGVLRVGVFVDETPERIAAVVGEAKLDVVQCHGNESPAVCAALPGRVWKAVHLERTPPAEWSRYAVDAFLVDGYSAAAPGGTGIRADWDRAAAFREAAGRPVLLAGGLTPENLAEAMRRVRPWGVDVSSGVEAAPGRKDMARVRAFIEMSRTYENGAG